MRMREASIPRAPQQVFTTNDDEHTMDAQLSAHIRHLLLDYVRCHITTDYVQFTETAVAELVSLEQIPTYDPASLTLPSDPFATLSLFHNLENLPPYQEKPTTTQDALQLIKKAIAQPKGRPKSENLVWGTDPWDEREDDAFYRVEAILTRRACRETPVLGKTGGAHRAVGMQKVEFGSYKHLTASKPIICKPIHVEPIQEPEVKANQVLDVIYNLKAADHAAVRALLRSVAAMNKAQPVPSSAIKDYRLAFLPAGFVHDPPRPLTPPLDSPPLTPIFARNERYRLAEDMGAKMGVLRSFKELPERLGAKGKVLVEVEEDGNMVSADVLARASMVVVDGWQTFAPSSPSTVSSAADEEFDELAEMFPSSPDTSVVGAMNLVQDVENSKLDEVQIPKGRRIGGSLGFSKESIVDKARKAGGLGAFLTPLLRSSEEKDPAPDLHPLFHDKMARLPRRDPAHKEDEKTASRIVVEGEADSMLGQASTAPSIAFGHNLEGTSEKEEDDDIRGLYQDLSRPGEKRLGPPLPRDLVDPKALIRNERLFEEETKPKGGEKGKKNDGLRLQLMPVPMLPEPNVGIRRNVFVYSDFLVAGADSKLPGDEEDGKGGKYASLSPMRFLKSTKGIAPLRVALSWVPFTRTMPIPAHVGMLLNDLEGVEDERREVDALLMSVCGDDRQGGERGCGIGDESRWRDCGLGGEDELVGGFSAEVAKCEIILTRKEREALLARQRGNTAGGAERGDGDVSGADDKQSQAGIEVDGLILSIDDEESGSAKRSMQNPGCHKDDANEVNDRPTKRPRLTFNDTGIGFMPEELEGGLFFESGGHKEQDGLQDDAEEDMLRYDFTDDQQMLLDPDDTFDVNDGRDIAGAVEYEDDDTNISYANTYGEAQTHNLEMGPAGHEPWMYQKYYRGDEDASGSSELLSYDPSSAQHPPTLGTRFTEAVGVHNTLARNFRTQHQPLHATHTVMMNTEAAGHSETNYDDSLHPKIPLKNLDLDLASHSLGIETFAKLRAKVITTKPASQPAFMGNEEPDTQELPQLPLRVQARTPQELYDNKTVQLPSQLPLPQAIHKYMASLDLLQKQALVRSLVAQECLVDLVERDSLGGVDLIIDPQTAVIFASLLSLPAHGKKLLETLSTQSWRYKRILIVFEAYPESRSYRQPQKRGHGGPEPELYAYTPPIVKAVKRFRRDMAIAEGCGKKAVACEVWCAFADSVNKAATCARLFGDEAEQADWTEGALWGEREWLDVDMSEDEQTLSLLAGMNCFSALIVLCQMTLQQFLDISPEERLTTTGPFVGVDAIAEFNSDIEERLRAMEEVEPDVNTFSLS
ncbi:hypothetical protein DXG01_015814 [Tephrocybe rancida]|nr:hypothetical protein DXG01_015814 [Tephrocybe rancida]